ncbi:MAG: asparagine synthase (glutamine-hydrolyzing) [Candidatus Latescibacteria bacterium]|nr:asparagine synthase (glutamine-hydrolyzing) [Candidatus Latescibacterota bacterium]
MCGIFGMCLLDGKSSDTVTGQVKKGVELLRHRGPDEFGIEARESVCFGHARLSIIDLEGGHQPMWDITKKGMVCYNGEVYNFREIRHELEKLGYRFASRSDTEVVLNAYLEWGAECVTRFRGMFAFAVFDVKKKTVLFARDRLGIKPLFYTIHNGSLCFSSELESLYRTIGPFEMDIESLDDYLNWQYIHAPKTIYKDVRSLPPAHLLEIDLNSGKINEKRYWNLNFREDRTLSVDDWRHLLDEKVREAVDIRLVSDVPFGAFLSGGIDSSLVTGYMAEIMEQPVKTFSIGFEESDFSELDYANRVAEINRTEHHTEIVKAESLSLLPMLVRHYGQPFADSSAIPTYYVSRMARKNVKMVLSGDGGDENFAGYNSYETVIRELYRTYNDRALTMKKRILRLGFNYFWKFKQWAQLGDLTDKAYELHCYTARHFSPIERRNLFRQEYRSYVRDFNDERRALMNIGRQPLISKLQNLDLMAYLPFDILTKVDCVSMANSLEVRVPLLDHILVETAATMPSEYKFKKEIIDGTVNYDKKFILKQLALQRYPSDIIYRPKMGFGVPLGIWFATTLQQQIREKLLKSEFLPCLFSMKHIEKIVDMHSETADFSTKLWNLLFLEEWMSSHHDSFPS